MKQTQAFLSTYTADVSGVCSALFELGGMTVMHDASGCNSTYNTHDEPRWYDMDSAGLHLGPFRAGGCDGRRRKADRRHRPRGKELLPAFHCPGRNADSDDHRLRPCPPLPGKSKAGPAFRPSSFPPTASGSYVSGAGQALRLYAERFVLPAHEKQKNAVNILGATPLDFSVNGQIQSIARRLTEGGFSVQSVWAMGSETWLPSTAAGEAEVNLVVSSVGLPVAKFLRERFGTPYVIGVPFGDMVSRPVLGALQKSIRTGEN